MKMFRLITATMFFAVIFSISAFAQTATKIGLIDTGAFGEEKVGITTYVSALKKLQAEFEPRRIQLQAMNDKIVALDKELQVLVKQYQDAVSTGKVSPIAPETIQAKKDEGERMARELKFQQDEAQVAFNARRQSVLSPLNEEIGKAVTEFSKQKGFNMVLDTGKLVDAGLIIYADEQSDVTEEFIKFYNTRAPGTTPVKPPVKPATPATKPN